LSAPIIRRELVSVLRDRRTAVWQLALAAAFALLLAARWPTDVRMALSGTRSQEIFRTFAGGLLAAVLLLLPVFPATSVVREKNQGTLALLLNTPLGAGRIFLGKFLGTLGLAGLILALSFPAACACYALGGIDFTRSILGAYLVLALAAIQYTALGLLVSSYAASSDAAIRWTYGVVFGLCFAALIPHHFFVGHGGAVSIAVEWLRCASPLAAMLELLGAGDLGSRGVVSTVDVVRRFMILSLSLSSIAAVWTIMRLNYRIFDRARAAGVAVDDRGLAERVSRRLFFIVDPGRRSRSIGPLVNPVMVKEFRCRRFGRLHWLLRLVSVCAVLSLALTILTTTRTLDWDVAMIGAIMVVLQVALLVLITPSLAAGLISAERESGGWTLLQMTPLSIWRIVWGKLLSVLLTLGLLLCATLPGYLVMVYIEPGQRFQAQRVVVCLILTAVFCMLSCAAAGSLFRRTPVSTIVAYSVLLSVCCGPLLLWLGRDAPFGHDVVEAALTVNPVAAALSVIRLRGFTDYELIPGNWWFLGIASLVSLVLLIVQTYRVSRPQ
jgi:ABC-type transport system involved in multi-copper enzyme maturation permease subunit